jgi:diguanylate cyclase
MPLITLHLDRSPAALASELDLLRRLLDEAIATLGDVLKAADAGAPPEVLGAADACRAELAAGAGAEALGAPARACFDAARQVAAQAHIRTYEQRAQVAALVAAVSDTVAAIAGDEESLQNILAGSARRFERLGQVDDLRQIQAQLLAEVTALKRITIERRTAWEQRSREFGARLAILETQLDHTRQEAAIDPLTRVANRRTFERSCREWLAAGRRGFVMAVVDVDDFKRINDRHGHAVGDRVLTTVAESLGSLLRAGDLVARFGGDEFAVLAADLTLVQAEHRFEIIGRAVREACRPLVPEGTEASISIGVAECSAGDTLESLRERADAAMYQAKKQGKARVAGRATPYLRDLRTPR